ncbi:hypothetical protein HanRHA438_Chr02g0096081 [Helianthus annuus]|nr:hypothetical protein HanRHA438_Chr02g0096081 [Helianthus annuus]
MYAPFRRPVRKWAEQKAIHQAQSITQKLNGVSIVLPQVFKLRFLMLLCVVMLVLCRIWHNLARTFGHVVFCLLFCTS